MTLQNIIETAWEKRDTINSTTKGEVRHAVEQVITSLDDGSMRVAQKSLRAGEGSSEWQVNQWVKKAILLSFRLNNMQLIRGPQMDDGAIPSYWYDKVPLKTTGWDEARFKKAGFRAVPGSFVRRGAYIAPNVVLMPSFVNLGAYVDEGTMIDTWATVGSCAQIGKHCHISGGTGIGGVLEPLQAGPVIIEDNCFIGARSEIAEGVVVETGSVISMGVFIGASTKIVDRETGVASYGRVPAYSVVVPGTLPGKTPNSPALACAVIVKRVDEKTRSKTGINDILRAI
jgi:2,3,4,5-tetrahydropyridine-2-carboxylate N-succinyltransferase